MEWLLRTAIDDAGDFRLAAVSNLTAEEQEQFLRAARRHCVLPELLRRFELATIGMKVCISYSGAVRKTR